MSFLMGLHDLLAQARGRILLLDSLPPINKVFALILQEENERKISTQSIDADSNKGAVFDNGK